MTKPLAPPHSTAARQATKALGRPLAAGSMPSPQTGYSIHTFSNRGKYLELKGKAPLPSRGESRRTPKASDGFAGWGEGAEYQIPNGFQPSAPLIPTLLPQGEKGFSFPTRTLPFRNMCEYCSPSRERGWGEGEKEPSRPRWAGPHPSSQPFSRKGRRAFSHIQSFKRLPWGRSGGVDGRSAWSVPVSQKSEQRPLNSQSP